ncbi:MAG: UDP-3-O-acyl-N-acetylglucosamine deacetylase [Candidatus Aminicenantales bacterium]
MKTLKREISLSGVGVHTGRDVRLILKPSTSGSLIFRRVDLGGMELCPDPRHIEAKNSTVLTGEKFRIQTVEHLMAALYAFGIDSLVVELDRDEVPFLDGSAVPFARAFLQAGVKSLHLKKKCMKILKPFTLRDKDASFSFSPDSCLRLSYRIDYFHPAVRKQEVSLEMNAEIFLREIAPARTFGFLRDVDALRRQGLALGASLDNTIALDEKKVVNGPLRFPDEFVRHKLLDLLGDLALLGFPLIGHFKGDRAGHYLHLKAVRFLLDNPEFWTYQ